MSTQDLSQLSMRDLFRIEAESQSEVLTNGLLALERNPRAVEHLEACMRAAHSLKGAARIVDIDSGVALAHAMEDFLVAAQAGRVVLHQEQIDFLLKGVDLMMAITRMPDLEIGGGAGKRRPEVDAFVDALGQILKGAAPPATKIDVSGIAPPPDARPGSPLEQPTAPQSERIPERDNQDRALRVTVENLNRLLGLAGETLVGSRWLKPFGESLARLKRLHSDSAKAVDELRAALSKQNLDESALSALAEAQRKNAECQQYLADRLAELDAADLHSTNLAHRLYDQALACRMRPFADGISGFQRMIRDVARSLGKQVRLELIGTSTQVDRDILVRLEAPLGHLLRNAVDHGIESPERRIAAGKAPEGVITLQAHHAAGALQIIVADDGFGVDPQKLRQTVVARNLTNIDTAARLSESELLEFLFLPGFSMKEGVTEISGRGVGLDVVQDMIKEVRGVVRVASELGKGTRFHLQLPLTLSVVRTLLAQVNGEPYAFPFAHIVRALRVRRDEIKVFEGREYFDFDGQHVGLVTAHQVLEGREARSANHELAVIVIGDEQNRYGLVVDGFLGGRELVVHPLDPRLGKIKDFSSAALMEDGSPVLIADVDDMIRSMEKLAYVDRLAKVEESAGSAEQRPRKRVLVVDDSLTVRELERKLLDQRGYEVEVAVDGMDGWNAARTRRFDLIITDIDMPRLDGIELVGLIKKDADLRGVPVMILSYKDREEDRRRGLEAGADYYLTKGSFHDATLLDAVMDLIGEAV